jgi:outer membrane protein
MISVNIRKLRIKRGISQDRLSKITDLSLNTIVKIESGKNPNPTIKTLYKIAKSFNIKVDDLIKVVLILYCLGIFMPYGFCQEDKVNTQISLSLPDAITIAFRNNKQIQIQEQEIEAARADILGAKAGFLPTVNASAGYTRNGAVLNLGSSLTRGAKKDIGVLSGYKDDNRIGVTIDESIYNGGANIANFKQAQLKFKTQEETLRAQKLDVEFETKRLYYGLLLAYETERITQELVDQAKSHYEDVRKKFNEGTSSRFDLLQSKVQVSKITPELVKAKNAVDLIMADLKKLLGLKMAANVTIKEKLAYSPVEIKEGEFLQQAYLNKPEMTLKALGIDINRWAIQMAKSGFRPQVSADLGYSYRSNNLGNMFNNRHSNWSTGFSISIPIFDGFSSKAKVDEAKARYIQSNLEKEDLIDTIAVDIRQACLDLQEAEALIYSQKDNIDEAREALRISEISYANGVGTNLDCLDAQVSLSQLEKNLSEGIYNYLMAKAFLDRTMGEGFLKEARNEKKD